ncbi:CopG family ribbon-helix-helix protein [Candidatus Parvarchaeota archaeon]|nr:CopG family ribbon-helix-helix protein [Candidatus Parvarchaeota archaeon]
MPIISVSVDDKTLEELKQLERELDFSGRSDAIRAGIRKLISENNERKRMKGKTKAVLLVVHSQDDEDKANGAKHQFEDIIGMQIHSDMGGGKCLEIFVMDGDAKRVQDFVGQMQSNKGIENLKLVLP